MPFSKVAPIVDFPAVEAEIRRFWKERDIFGKALDKTEGGPRFVFYEGPPTANGLPHNGHVLTRVIKDVFPRYKTMRGYHVPRKAGWDTHGLPVEIEVEKELRISGKDAIAEFGIEPFVRRCLETVFRYTNEWEQQTEKLAFWVDLENAYATFHESYVESVWWALSELFKKGLLYHGHKVVWWWAQGGTALSAGEVGQGYRTIEDPSVYVRLPLADEPGTSLLAWTTTPWTLSSNMFAAVKPDYEYALVRDGDEKLVVAKALVETLATKVDRNLEVEATFSGEALLGRHYEPPFDWFENEAGEDIWRVVGADFVELDAGTGVVHEAPAFGEVDFELFREELEKLPNLSLLNAVQPDGTFDPEVAPKGYHDRFVKDCDRDLTRELDERGVLWHSERFRHEYPFCWRSDQDPLIQYARPTWYVGTTKFVEVALANNAEIRWLPEHIRDGRFGDFLRNNVDWALSRERFWGTPLNIWINDETGRMESPASVAEILERNPAAFDAFEAARASDPGISPHLRVHKPWIDQVTWQKPREPGTYRRVPEVIDCWFDAGSMPFAQFGYPHRGRKEFEKCFPADFISEAIDQTRGWFNSLLWISNLLFEDVEKPHPYRTCLVLGHVCDREGKKESKSKGNYTSPDIILDRVRLEFAVVTKGEEPPPGELWISREDYEGLDFTGETTQVVAYRDDAPEKRLELEAKPRRLPRRVALLSERERRSLDLEGAPNGLRTLPVDVPGLAPPQRLWIEDPQTTAPGADAFRWFFFAANPPWNSTRHSLGAVRAQQRELPLKLRNVYSFFSIYANIDCFDPGSARCRDGRRLPGARSLLDRWILSELMLSNRRVIERMDEYLVYDACMVLTDFVEALSNWYVRRSRDRFWAPGLEQDKLDAHWTLYECLVRAARMLAPFLPYASEEIWQNLVRRPHPDSEPESVHLADYPEPDAECLDEALSEEMGIVREIVKLGLQVRTTEKLRVRQPLEAVEIVLARPDLEQRIRPYVELIAEELNVHETHFVPKADEYVGYRIRPNFRALGPKVGKLMPAVKKALNEADGAALLQELSESGGAVLEVDGTRLELGPDEIAVRLEAKEGFAAAGSSAGVVVLRTILTPELIREGLHNEVKNRIQTFRKELGLEYTARIRVSLDGHPAILEAVAPRAVELRVATLATSLVLGSEPEPGAEVRDVEIDGKPLTIGLTRV
ncbi:MAG: isoleucine--tRNA ligase [Planctomycetota bacterium]